MNTWRKHPQTKSLFVLMALLLMSSTVIYREFLFGNSLLAFTDVGSDTWQQYVMHYHTMVNHLKEGTFSFWDFNNGFGVNQFQLYLFDPSLLLLYAIGVLFGPEVMLEALVYVQILRILAAGAAGYFFLSEFSLSERAKVFASYLYGLNGFLLVWGQHYQFGIVTVYLPLILLMVERSLKKGKMGMGIPFSVFLIVIDSTYFAYMCCLTAGIFLVFRVLLMEETEKKERIKRFFKVCGGILLGVGMGLCVMLPSSQVIFGVTARLESEYSLPERLLMGLIPMERDYYKMIFYRILSANFFSGSGTCSIPGINYYEAPSLFFSIFLVILGSQYVFLLWKTNNSRFRKIVLYGAMAFGIFAVTFPLMGIIYNGFSIQINYENMTVIPFSRFTFAYLPFFALLMAWMADYFWKGGRPSLTAMVVDLILICYGFLRGPQMVMGAAEKKLLFLMGAVSVISVLAVGIFFIRRWKNVQKPLMILFLSLAVVDVTLEGLGTVTERQTVKKQEESYLSQLYDPDVQAALNYLKETDPEFYRVEKTFEEKTPCLSSLAQNYRGVSTYNSMQNGNIAAFVKNCAPDLPFWDMNHYWFGRKIWNDGKMANFLGVRYLLSKEEVPEDYELVKEFGTVKVYRAREEVDIGKFYKTSQIVTNEELQTMANQCGSQALISEVLLSNVGMETEGLELPAVKEKENSSKTAEMSFQTVGNDSHIRGEIQAPEDGCLLMTIPFENGWELTLDGKKQEFRKADLGFIGIPVSKGNHTVELNFRAPLLYEGILLSGVFWLIYLIYCIIYRRKGVQKS